MRFSDVLLEHNIINLPDLEQWVDGLANQCHFQDGADWVRSKFRKYLINADETADRVAGLSPNAPEWMAKRFQEGVPLHRFRASPGLGSKLGHIVDWLNSLQHYATTEQTHPAEQLLAREAEITLPKLDKFSVEQAEAATEKWFARLNKSASKLISTEAGSGTINILSTPVGNWVELLDKEATKYEGAKMGHCVGGGTYTVGDGGSYRIFSLRDSKNEPHVTVSMTKSNKQLNQIKGKQNYAPVAKYQQAVVDLLNEVKCVVNGTNSDLKQMGIFYNNGAFGGIQDVGKKVAEIDTVTVFELVGAKDYYDSPTNLEYYLWRKHAYGKLTVNRSGRTSATGGKHMLMGLEYFDDKPGVRTAVWKIMAKFLNSLDPVPVPSPSLTGKIMPLYLDGVYYETREEMSKDIGVLSDGTRVKKFTGHLMQTVDLFDEHGQHILSISEDSKKGQFAAAEERFSLTAIPVAGVPTPPAKTIYEAINMAGLRGAASKSLRDLGVWPAKTSAMHLPGDGQDWNTGRTELAVFDPAKIGFTHIGADIWGGQREMGRSGDNDKAFLYDSNGRAIGRITYNDSKHDTVTGLLVKRAVSPPNGEQSSTYADYVEKVMHDNVSNLVSWLNRIRWPEPTRPYQRDQMKHYNIARKGGQWVSITDAAPKTTEGNFSIQAMNKNITLTNAAGELVLSAQKGQSVDEGVYLKTLVGSEEEQRDALLALDSFLSKSKWYVAQEYKMMGAAGLAIDKETKRLKPWVEVYPPRIVKAYDDGTKLAEEYQSVYDEPLAEKLGQLVNSWPCAGKYTLRVKDDMTARIYTKDKQINYIIVRGEDGEFARADATTIVGLIPYLSDLIEAETLKINREVFTKWFGLTMMSGKLRPVSDDARIEEFMRGKINYEDGKRWQKPRYTSKDYNWELVEDVPSSYGTGTTETTIVRAKIGQHGIENVTFNKKEAQRSAKAYMGYIMDLVELAVGE